MILFYFYFSCCSRVPSRPHCTLLFKSPATTMMTWWVEPVLRYLYGNMVVVGAVSSLSWCLIPTTRLVDVSRLRPCCLLNEMWKESKAAPYHSLKFKQSHYKFGVALLALSMFHSNMWDKMKGSEVSVWMKGLILDNTLPSLPSLVHTNQQSRSHSHHRLTVRRLVYVKGPCLRC